MNTLVVVGVLLSFVLGGAGFVALLVFLYVAQKRSGPPHAQVVAGLQRRFPGSVWQASRVDGLLTVMEERSLRLHRWLDDDHPAAMRHELTLNLVGLVDELLWMTGPARRGGEDAPRDFAAHFKTRDVQPLMQQVLADPEVQASLLRLARLGTSVSIREQRLHADRVDLPWESEPVGDYVEEALAVARALSRAGHALVQQPQQRAG